jgi:hypothetical protein
MGDVPAIRLQTQAWPEGDESGEGNGGQEVPGEFIVAGCDASKVLQSAEGVFDEMAFLVTPFVTPDGALSVRPAGNDRDDCRPAQVLSQAVGVVSLVCEQKSCALQPGRQMGCDRTVRGIAAGQHEGEGTADRVRKGMDFGGLAAPRGPDCLIFRPPFPPWAGRCALTWVLSIELLLVTAPDVASASTSSIPKRLTGIGLSLSGNDM